ncbi:hypothetical protein Tco_1120435 [Tanacetum coccineum]
MANLDFCDKHNMVAYLQKSEGSEGFHQIIDFLTTSHIRYALTESPTIYVSLIEQFWQTASASTLENGDMEITATIDGKVKVVSEASIRRHLKLEDSDGISTLPTSEIFEQLALMGYVSNSDNLTFQKGHFSPQWKFLIHTILHCLSSKKTAWEQFSSNIATAIICLATNRTFNFSKLIFDAMVKNLDSKTKFLMYPRFIQIFLNKHKRLLLPHKRLYIAPTLTQKLFSNMKRASKGYTGVDTPLFQTMLVQGQILQGEGSTIPVEHESVVPQPRSPTLGLCADVKHEGAATTITSLDAGQGSDRVVALETDLHQTKKVYGTSFTKLIKKVKKLEKTVKTRQVKRKAIIVVSDDEEDLEDPSKQGRKIAKIDQDPNISLVQHDAEVQGCVEAFSTAGASVSTVGASSAKDKEIQSEEREMYSEAEKARLLAELINERKRYFANIGSHTLKQLKSYSFDEIKNLFETTMRRVHTFVLMESESERVILELAAGSSKRDAEEELVQESPKRLKTGESLVPAEEPKDKEKELSTKMIQNGGKDLSGRCGVSVKRSSHQLNQHKTKKENYRLYDTRGVHHVSTKDGMDIYMLVEREYPLSRGVLTQMLVAKLLVEQDSEMSRELLRKIFM